MDARAVLAGEQVLSQENHWRLASLDWVPGKFQAAVESGLDFVRQEIVHQMIGSEGMRFMPFLATLFFFIFLGNILEVVPGLSFPVNSRAAFPLVMALITWVTYNAVGIRRHGVVDPVE